MKRIAFMGWLLAGSALINAAAPEPPAPPPAAPAPRPARWAEPLTLDGVPNFYRIAPMVYRSEQPTADGMKNLEKLGIRTVINLRAVRDDDEEVRGTSLRMENIKIFTWHVEDEDVVRVLGLLRHTENGPFLIHCKHGADRTGLMTAMYRIIEQGWTPKDALQELTEGGYGYHSIWSNIRRYVLSVDVGRLRAAIDSAAAAVSGVTTTVTDN